MGGFGAINIALKHPDIFSVLYSLSPGLFGAEEPSLRAAVEGWKDVHGPFYNPGFLPAYGAAFSPDANLSAPYACIPLFNNTPEDNMVVSNWMAGFGNPEDKIRSYNKSPSRLRNVMIEWGDSDEFIWIPEGCKHFKSVLDKYGIKNTAVTFKGGHNDRVGERITFSMLPFFSENLSNE